MTQIGLDSYARGAWVRSRISVAKPYSLYLIPLALILVHGKFFFWANFSFEQHPLALPGLREAYLIVSLLFTIGFVLGALYRGRWYAADVTLVALVLALNLICATLAYLSFGQPLPFGVLEERRMGAFLSFFIFLFLIERYRLHPHALLSSIHVAVLIYLILGLVLQTGVLGDLTDRDIPYLDPRKYRIFSGTELYMISMAISLVMIIRFKVWSYVVPLMVGVAGMLLISQTRSAMVVMAAAGIVIFGLSSPLRFLMLAVSSVALLLTALFGGDLLYMLVEDVHALVAAIFPSQGAHGPPEMSLEDSVRTHTAAIILSELRANDWMGMGSLSLQWNGGFHTVYDRHFFLTDVGVLGELYRFGLLLPLAYGGLFFAIYCFLKPIKDPVGRHVLLGILALLVVNAPMGSGFISLPGEFYALLFAIAAAYRNQEALRGRFVLRRSMEEPSPATPLETASEVEPAVTDRGLADTAPPATRAP